MPQRISRILSLVLVLGGIAFIAVFPYLGADRGFLGNHPGAVNPWSARADAEVREEPINTNAGDKHIIVIPDQSFTNESLQRGDLPLWNPFNFAGLPHVANPLAGVFYPPNWLHRFGEPHRVFPFLHAFHLFFAGLCAFYFLRTIRLSFLASLFGAAAFELGGWFSAHAHLVFFVHAFTWMPLIPAGLEEIFRGRGRGALVVAAGMALIALGGFPQILVITGYFAAAYGLALALERWRRDDFRRAFSRGLIAAGSGLAGLLVAAPMLLPAFQLSEQAGHQVKNVEWLVADRLEAGALLHAAFPEAFGVPDDQPDPSGGFLTSWLLSRPGELILANNYTERSFHAGLLVIVLALSAIFMRRWRSWFFIGVVIGALAMALGTPLLRLMFPLPGIAFGSPMRWTSLIAFALPVLAAMRVHTLLEDRNRGLLALRIISIVVAAALLAAMAALWLSPDRVTDHATDYLLSIGVDEKIGIADDKSRDEKRALLHEVVLDLRQPGGPLFPVALAALLAAAWSLAFRRLRQNSALVVALAIALLAGQQLFHHFRLQPVIDTSEIEKLVSPEIEFLREKLGAQRFVRVGPGDESVLFTPNAPMKHGLRDLQGFRALTPQSFLDFMRSVAPNPHDVGFPNLAEEDLNAPQLDFLSVRYAISTKPLSATDWPLVYPASPNDAAAFYIHENPEAMPRAFMARDVERLDRARTRDLLEQLRADRRQAEILKQTAWVASDEEIPEASGAVLNFAEEPGQITIDLAPSTAGLCVTSTQYDAGWKAESIAGTEREELSIVRADHAFMGVVVPPGTSRIEMRYEPRSLRLGAYLALAGALLALCLGVLLVRLRTPQEGGPASDDELEVLKEIENIVSQD